MRPLMKTKVTATLREEVERFRLQFACGHCAYFDPARDRCSEGYPNDEHRDGHLRSEEILFCKLFEAS